MVILLPKAGGHGCNGLQLLLSSKGVNPGWHKLILMQKAGGQGSNDLQLLLSSKGVKCLRV